MAPSTNFYPLTHLFYSGKHYVSKTYIVVFCHLLYLFSLYIWVRNHLVILFHCGFAVLRTVSTSFIHAIFKSMTIVLIVYSISQCFTRFIVLALEVVFYSDVFILHIISVGSCLLLYYWHYIPYCRLSQWMYFCLNILGEFFLCMIYRWIMALLILSIQPFYLLFGMSPGHSHLEWFSLRGDYYWYSILFSSCFIFLLLLLFHNYFGGIFSLMMLLIFLLFSLSVLGIEFCLMLMVRLDCTISVCLRYFLCVINSF